MQPIGEKKGVLRRSLLLITGSSGKLKKVGIVSKSHLTPINRCFLIFQKYFTKWRVFNLRKCFVSRQRKTYRNNIGSLLNFLFNQLITKNFIFIVLSLVHARVCKVLR